MKSKPTKIALIQAKCSGNVAENYLKTIEKIKQAAANGANIVCTQELFKSLYFCQTVDSEHLLLAEDVTENSETILDLATLCEQLGIVLVASLFEDRGTGVYHNATVVIDADGSYLGKYRKMHIPEDPLFLEKFYFTPGDSTDQDDGYRVFNTAYGNLGVLICWDQWFPEAARLTALKGADIIFYPTAIGYPKSENDSHIDLSGDDYATNAWQTVQRGHAVANGCFVAAVNRVGFEECPGTNGEDGIHFWGQSFIADPCGVIMAQASRSEEEILMLEVDLAESKETRRTSAYFFRDRRIDSYENISKRSLIS